MKVGPGTLFLCATPIGNLGDMTFRAVETLRGVSLIAAEDTRHSRKLISHFDIHVPITSYHEHNKRNKGAELIGKLLSGQDIALVSDAGMPGISDPGADLVRLAVEAGIRVCPIPGPNAALTALVASGLCTDSFVFVGFLPKHSAQRRAQLRRLQGLPYTLLFYESPHQLKKTLADILTVLGDRRAVIGRELTKIHEEFQRGALTSLIEWFEAHSPRGEFTLIIEGHDGTENGTLENSTISREISDEMIVENLRRLLAEGENKKDAVRMTASKWSLSKRRVYQLSIGIG